MPAIAVSSSGTLVTGVPGMRIVMRSFHVQIAAADGIKFVKFQSGSTDLTGNLYQPVTCPPSDDRDGWFWTVPGDDLKISLSASFVVGGFFEYSLEPQPGP